MVQKSTKAHDLIRTNVAALILVTVPLIAIVAMAIWAITSEHLASRARAMDAARYGASVVGKQVETAFKAALQHRLLAKSAHIADSQDPVGMLHRMGRIDTSSFTVLFEDDVRVFPPLESTAILWNEKVYLSQIESALKRARTLANSTDIGVATSARPTEQPVFVACKRILQTQVLCTAIPLPALKNTVIQKLANAKPVITQTFRLIDPKGTLHFLAKTNDLITADTIDLDLAGPLEGWRLRADANTNATNTYALLMAAIIGPVIVAWGFGLWSLVRRQSDAVRQHKERAEGAARLSHDLRTPIANLAIYVDLISRHGKNMPAIMRCCKALDEEITRLAIIAESTLRRSRGLPPQSTTRAGVEADHVIQTLVSRYKPLMEKSGCTITFNAGAPSAIVGDQTALERILVNLIDNARAHAGGANVQVSTKKSADQLVLTIDDDGRSPSSQSDHVTANHGLGLKVIEELTQSCGGAFKPMIEASGSQFEVALPTLATTHYEVKPNEPITNSNPACRG